MGCGRVIVMAMMMMILVRWIYRVFFFSSGEGEETNGLVCWRRNGRSCKWLETRRSFFLLVDFLGRGKDCTHSAFLGRTHLSMKLRAPLFGKGKMGKLGENGVFGEEDGKGTLWKSSYLTYYLHSCLGGVFIIFYLIHLPTLPTFWVQK